MDFTEKICPILHPPSGDIIRCVGERCMFFRPKEETCVMQIAGDFIQSQLVQEQLNTSRTLQDTAYGKMMGAQRLGCEKCVNEVQCALDDIWGDDKRCPGYHRDPPDGGYYG